MSFFYNLFTSKLINSKINKYYCDYQGYTTSQVKSIEKHFFASFTLIARTHILNHSHPPSTNTTRGFENLRMFP